MSSCYTPRCLGSRSLAGARCIVVRLQGITHCLLRMEFNRFLPQCRLSVRGLCNAGGIEGLVRLGFFVVQHTVRLKAYPVTFGEFLQNDGGLSPPLYFGALLLYGAASACQVRKMHEYCIVQHERHPPSFARWPHCPMRRPIMSWMCRWYCRRSASYIRMTCRWSFCPLLLDCSRKAARHYPAIPFRSLSSAQVLLYAGRSTLIFRK